MKRCTLCLIALVLIGTAFAQQVPLLRQAPIEDLSVTLYADSDRAMVQETCQVLLPAGESEVRFQWTDADVDAGAISLRSAQPVVVGGVRQPAGTSKTFAWPVRVDQAGEYRFVASYFVRSIKWSATYRLSFDAEAGTAALVGQLHLTNAGKLPLRGVDVSLCVAPSGVLGRMESAEAGGVLPTLARLEDFTLEPGWQRRVSFIRARDLPARVVYRAEPESQGQKVRRFLIVDMKDLGLPTALPKGHLEVSERVGLDLVPVAAGDLVQAQDKDTEILLGDEPNVIFERKILKRGKNMLEFDRLGRVSGYDTTEEVSDLLRNRRASAIKVELIEGIGGKWDFTSPDAPTLKEANLLKWEFELPAGKAREIRFTITRHTGTRAD